jgi:hypothetical protein
MARPYGKGLGIIPIKARLIYPNGELETKFQAALHAFFPALAMSPSKFHSNTLKILINENDESIQFPTLYLLHFPELYLPSNLHIPEGRVGTSWEISDPWLLYYL